MKCLQLVTEIIKVISLMCQQEWLKMILHISKVLLVSNDWLIFLNL